MNRYLRLLPIIAAATVLSACGTDADVQRSLTSGAMPEEAGEERGPNNGRLLRDGDFVLELAIFETGVSPEFRAWPRVQGRPIDPEQVDVTVRLTRLGDQIDQIEFYPQDDFMRGDTVVYEPHSFVVSVEAAHDGRSHHWEYDSFEGRTRIGAQMATAFGLETMLAGPAVLSEAITVYGTIAPNADRVRQVSARFDGAIESVAVSLGEAVVQGQALARIESNESLQSYSISAPIAGVVLKRNANPGEQTAGRQLFTIVDPSSVWAELAIFPTDRSRIQVGADVTIMPATGGDAAHGTISYIDLLAGANQAVTARVVLDNTDNRWALGTYVIADIAVAQYQVPLAVKRSALQSFRDFTVVYAQVGEEYEVRMLDLGRQAGDWVEVLGGLEPGTRYVTENSYVLKADVEKSGASHDH
jgi:cobalt-zinc-cadmium efflux system membrane fusion protein